MVLDEEQAKSKISEKLFIWLPSKLQQLQRFISFMWCQLHFYPVLFSVCFLFQTFVLAETTAVHAPCRPTTANVSSGEKEVSYPGRVTCAFSCLLLSVTFNESSLSFALQEAQLNANISIALPSGESTLEIYLVAHGIRWRGRHCDCNTVALDTPLQEKC